MTLENSDISYSFCHSVYHCKALLSY